MLGNVTLQDIDFHLVLLLSAGLPVFPLCLNLESVHSIPFPFLWGVGCLVACGVKRDLGPNCSTYRISAHLSVFSPASHPALRDDQPHNSWDLPGSSSRALPPVSPSAGCVVSAFSGLLHPLAIAQLRFGFPSLTDISQLLSCCLPSSSLPPRRSFLIP